MRTATNTNQRELVGHCGVDSGQIMLVDPCYVHNFKDGEEFKPDTYPYDFSYNGACGATLSESQMGELGNSTACVVSSGWGDGVYPVYVTRSSDGRIATATIVFIDENEEEE